MSLTWLVLQEFLFTLIYPESVVLQLHQLFFSSRNKLKKTFSRVRRATVLQFLLLVLGAESFYHDKSNHVGTLNWTQITLIVFPPYSFCIVNNWLWHNYLHIPLKFTHDLDYINHLQLWGETSGVWGILIICGMNNEVLVFVNSRE